MPVSASAPRTPTADAATTAPFGVASLATMIGGPPANYRDDAAAIRNLGASWVRVVVQWHKLEWNRGSYDWAAVDNAIQAASAHSLNILVLITGPAPLWAQAPGTEITANGNPPADPATFGNITRLIAERYKKSVRTWEIWNEPNVPEYFVPVNVPRYAALLRAAYSSIHAVQPDANVMSGGLSSNWHGVNPADFVRQLYDAGAGDSFDSVGVHPYTFPYPITEDPAGRGASIMNIYNVMSTHGQSNKKIWLTEYGQATGTNPAAVSEQRQAAILVDFLDRASAISFLGPSFLFTTKDLSSDKANLDFNFGLYRMDYSPKPVVSAIQALNR
nr:cellulase family glycosylhydrolase [Mycobacterium sp. JS623]